MEFFEVDRLPHLRSQATYMTNTRAKGTRNERKAMHFALSFPGSRVLRMYQGGRFFNTPQPFDLLWLRAGRIPVFIEVRFGQWRTGRDSTKDLASLPGRITKQIWRFRDRVLTPDIREWREGKWVKT